jgi:tetratricopeptide (TPR) repeat protein
LLDEPDPDLIECMNVLGMIAKKEAHYAAAKKYYQQALAATSAKQRPLSVASLLSNLADIERKVLRSIHQVTRYRCALNFFQEENYAAALPLYQKALKMTEAELGRQHPAVADILRSIGLVHKKRGEYSQAEQTYTTALDIMQKISLGCFLPVCTRFV